MELHVGILKASKIAFSFQGEYSYGGYLFQGAQNIELCGKQISFNGTLYDSLTFTPQQLEECAFSLEDVVIGIGFHWERKERQSFRATLRLVVDGDAIQAINDIDLEMYLLSVISSEMSATSSLELLKAHAVISRSWVAAPIVNGASATIPCDDAEQIWYERDAHTLFDVCADDHCQRYQGITRASTDAVREALEATRGEVLLYEDKICDARFSKCCGGIAETFENCWAPTPHPYLLGVVDTPQGEVRKEPMNEAEAMEFIAHKEPTCFCNTNDSTILRQVLNHYDQETPDFYRWEVGYSNEELSALIRQKTGVDYGTVTDLIPLQRGVSGRIIRLKIVGSKKTQVIGKELEIRRALSTSHLYSSAFIVTRLADGGFLLHGAGWGHGVGLCQIGAAVMAHQGYSYREILEHYYRNSSISRRW